MSRKIFFNIPFNGVKVSYRRYIVPQYDLPAKDWLVHNKVDIYLPNIEIVTCVRDPLERVVLQYLEHSKNRPALRQYPIGFKEWCIACYDPLYTDKFIQNNPKEFLTQKYWLSGLEDVIKIHTINQLSLPPEGLKVKFDFIKGYYDHETTNLVKEWYKEDYTLLNGK